MDGFAWDAGTMTARKLKRQVTAYSEGALQTALENGCKSVPEVMAFLARRDSQRVAKQRADSRRISGLSNIVLRRRA